MSEYIGKQARHALEQGNKHPYDGDEPAVSWAHYAVRGIISDLSGRGGLDDILDNFDDEIREEITEALVDIVHASRPLYAEIERETTLKAWSPEGVNEQVRSHLRRSVSMFDSNSTRSGWSLATLYERLQHIQLRLIRELHHHHNQLDNILEKVVRRSPDADVVRAGLERHKELVDLCTQTIFSYMPYVEARTVPIFDEWKEVVSNIEKNLDS
jgi:hypothetical protein